MTTYLAAGAAITAGVVALGQAAIVAINAWTAPTAPISLNLVDLKFEGGHFYQDIQPAGADSIRAEWAADISRGPLRLCGGGGIGNYDGTPHRFTPDDWTGDTCPPLQAGDVASATWEWRARDGYRRLSTKIVIE